MARPTYEKKEATEADKALLAKILGEAKPYVEKTQKDRNKKRDTWEEAVTKQNMEEIVKTKADYVLIDAKNLPAQITWAILPRNVQWFVCKSYPEFVAYIAEHGLPKHVAMDYSLSGPDDKVKHTAIDVLKYLGTYCTQENKMLPELSCHSKLTINQQTFDTQAMSLRSKIKKAINGNTTATSSVKTA